MLGSGSASPCLGHHAARPSRHRAYDERSGAYYNSGHRAEAKSDVDKACDAGINTACAFLKRLGP